MVTKVKSRKNGEKQGWVETNKQTKRQADDKKKYPRAHDIENGTFQFVEFTKL